jgi:hypothetical protein
VIVIHDPLFVAAQEHPAGAETAIVSLPPEALNECDEESSVTTHGAPASFTVKVLPAIEIVPDRAVVPTFGSTRNPTLPEPFPGEPLVTSIQLLLLVAVHPQPALVVTPTLPVPPPDPSDCDVAEIA